MSYMELEGYIVEQLGRGFALKKDNSQKLLMAEDFMSTYNIFSE
ncbi:hypothetical protein [Clostridioides sp. ES-S-0145-01]